MAGGSLCGDVAAILAEGDGFVTNHLPFRQSEALAFLQFWNADELEVVVRFGALIMAHIDGERTAVRRERDRSAAPRPVDALYLFRLRVTQFQEAVMILGP